MIRLLENKTRRELESVAYDRLLENIVPSGVVVLTVFPDAFQATAVSKTQMFLTATATPKTQSFFAATATIKKVDPFSATTQLYGTKH